MKSSRLTKLGLAGVFLCTAAFAHADTDADRIKRLEEQIKLLTDQVQQLKDSQAARDKEQVNAVSTKPQGAKPSQAAPANPAGGAAAGLRISGDVTTRIDITNERSRELGIIPEGEQGQFRGRFRLRLQTPVTNRSDAELYLVNGINTSPTAGFTSYSDFFRGKTLTFGRAYFNYYFGDKNKPNTASLAFGKMENPFWRGNVGNFASEIFWDNDVNPEGIAARIPITTSRKFSLSNTTGFFTIELPAKQLFRGLTTDTYQFGTQFKADSGIFHGAFSYYVFDNLNSGLLTENVTSQGFVDTSAGTSAFLLRNNTGLQNTNAHYSYGPTEAGFGANTFNIVNLSLQLQAKAKPNRVAPFLHYEYLNNGSVNFANQGWGITVGVNKSHTADQRATNRGDYTAWFTYRDVDADAALGTFADSDLGAGTDYRGYQLGFNYRIQDNLGFRAAYQDYYGVPLKTNHTSRLFLDLVRAF